MERNFNAYRKTERKEEKQGKVHGKLTQTWIQLRKMETNEQKMILNTVSIPTPCVCECL